MQGLLAFQRYFDFSGRSARAEYWQFMGIWVLSVLIAYLIDLAISGPYATPTLTIIVYLALVIPGYAVSVRRLHDRGRTGWWMAIQVALSVLGFVLNLAAANSIYTALGDFLSIAAKVVTTINLLFSIFLLVQVLKRGEDHANRFGPDPLEDPAPAPSIAYAYAKAQSMVAPAPVQPGASQPARPAGEDPLAQIERLAKLHAAGMLTQEEFTRQKAAYLSRL